MQEDELPTFVEQTNKAKYLHFQSCYYHYIDSNILLQCFIYELLMKLGIKTFEIPKEF